MDIFSNDDERLMGIDRMKPRFCGGWWAGPARTLSKPGKLEYCALIGLFVRFSVWLHLRRRTENER
jgi:hypothetical protein